MIYLLDTVVITDLLQFHVVVQNRLQNAKTEKAVIGICHPVYYEVLRGLLWSKVADRVPILRDNLIKKFDWIELEDDDWVQAAYMWADAVSRGKQLTDVEFLLAAMAFRRNATIVSSNNKFDELPIKRVNWRQTG